VLIDWFTVGAQIVNFIILIYLLKRFLYKPILRAMDEREQKIRDRLQDAAEKREKAKTEAESLAEERRDLESRREEMQAEAREEIDRWREETLAKVRDEVEEKRRSWQEAVAREQDDFIGRMKTVLSRQVFMAAAKAVEDLADEKLESRLVERFIDKLSGFFSDEKDMAEGEEGEVVIKTGFQLHDTLQQELKDATVELFPGREIDFAVDREIGFTIRLVVGNRRIEWGLDRYMETMEEKILNTLQLAESDGT
jgi:F-type H+-transporting ATPase subunit b